MFDRIKKALSRGDKAPPEAQAPAAGGWSPVSQWASTQGLGFTGEVKGAHFAVQGKVGDKPWRLEVGRPSRRYIQGEELRARAELDLQDEPAVMVINRPLKELLEKQAYSLYTDGLQTTADPNLPEEMRWLAMYEEFGWEAVSNRFWDRYAVVGDQPGRAKAWLDELLVEQLLAWPQPGVTAQVPFTLLLMRGKAYLRMQQDASDLPTLQHATDVFTAACASALGAFGRSR